MRRAYLAWQPVSILTFTVDHDAQEEYNNLTNVVNDRRHGSTLPPYRRRPDPELRSYFRMSDDEAHQTFTAIRFADNGEEISSYRVARALSRLSLAKTVSIR